MTTPACSSSHSATRLSAALAGSLLGTAAGDSVGLPFENLGPAWVARLLQLPLEQSLLARSGAVSDDTEHAVMTALSLRESGPNVAVFKQQLAARFRWWLAVLPPGVGSATARAILKLWFRATPSRSGVFSAGNGPAMRSALLGVVFADEPARMRDFVGASTRMTHTDPKAFEAALAVAVAAACAARMGPCPPAMVLAEFLRRFREVAGAQPAMSAELALLDEALRRDMSLSEFVAAMGCTKGITGYSLHTVPAALYAWVRHSGDFRRAITELVQCGGDTDSTAAIAGSIIGAGVGVQGIPGSWLEGLVEWPRSVPWMQRLAHSLGLSMCEKKFQRITRLRRFAELMALPWTLLRNLTVLLVVGYVLLRRTALALTRSSNTAVG